MFDLFSNLRLYSCDTIFLFLKLIFTRNYYKRTLTQQIFDISFSKVKKQQLYGVLYYFHLVYLLVTIW